MTKIELTYKVWRVYSGEEVEASTMVVRFRPAAAREVTESDLAADESSFGFFCVNFWINVSRNISTTPAGAVQSMGSLQEGTALISDW